LDEIDIQMPASYRPERNRSASAADFSLTKRMRSIHQIDLTDTKAVLPINRLL
jgi:hypothetical protein